MSVQYSMFVCVRVKCQMMSLCVVSMDDPSIWRNVRFPGENHCKSTQSDVLDCFAPPLLSFLSWFQRRISRKEAE